MTRTPRTPACLSDLALVQLDAGEVVSEAGRTHVDSCPRCRASLDDIAEQRAQFVTHTGAATPVWLAASKRRPLWRHPAVLASASALAAAALVLLLVRTSGQPTAPPLNGTRTKGRLFQLEVFVRHAGVVRIAARGEEVFPDDEVRFTVRGQGQHVAVFGLDSVGTASIYVPPIAVELSTSPTELPGAMQLDDVLGSERFLAIACVAPIDAEEIRYQLERLGNLTAPAGCTVDEFTLDKRAP